MAAVPRSLVLIARIFVELAAAHREPDIVPGAIGRAGSGPGETEMYIWDLSGGAVLCVLTPSVLSAPVQRAA